MTAHGITRMHLWFVNSLDTKLQVRGQNCLHIHKLETANSSNIIGTISASFHYFVMQMLFPSLIHTLESPPHLVHTLLTSIAMEVSLG